VVEINLVFTVQPSVNINFNTFCSEHSYWFVLVPFLHAHPLWEKLWKTRENDVDAEV